MDERDVERRKQNQGERNELGSERRGAKYPTRGEGARWERERNRQIARDNFSDVGRRGVSPSGGTQKASRMPLLRFFFLAASLPLYLQLSPIVHRFVFPYLIVAIEIT